MTSSVFTKQRFKSVPIAVLAGWFVASFATMSSVADVGWPFARRDALSSGSVGTALPDTVETRWTYKATDGAGFDATAVAAGGVVYVGDTDGTFHAVKLADGTSVWTKKFDSASFGAAAAIDVGSGRLFVGDLDGVVRCLELSDGRDVWQATLDSEVYAGPMIHEGNLLVTSEGGTLVCLDITDGTELWRFEIDAPLRCTPTVAHGRVMLAGCDSKLHFIDVSNGKELGAVEIDAPTGCTAAVKKSRAFFGTEGGTFYAIDLPTSADDEGEVAWTYRDSRRGQPIRAAAALSDAVVVYGSQGKAIFGLDPGNGKEIWKHPTRTRVESSPVIVEQRVVAATVGGILYILDSVTGEEIWKFEAGGSFLASPIVVGGKIVIGNGDGSLYCIGSPKSGGPAAPTVQGRAER